MGIAMETLKIKQLLSMTKNGYGIKSVLNITFGHNKEVEFDFFNFISRGVHVFLMGFIYATFDGIIFRTIMLKRFLYVFI